jgi:hypothetical protein
MKKIHLLPFLAVFATLGLQAQTEEKLATKTY